MGRGCLKWVALLFFSLFMAVFLAVLVVISRQTGLLGWMNVPAATPVFINRSTLVLDSVQQMSVLTTTRYNFSNVVTSEREMPPLLQALYGERQVLVAVGHVTAGIDLSQLRQEDIAIAGEMLTVVLPPPQIQDCFLNERESYIVQRDTGVFARSAPELEDQARQFAVGQFRDSALERGILEDVRGQAQIAIAQFIEALQIPGIKTVNVVVTPPLPDTPLPPSCQ